MCNCCKHKRQCIPTCIKNTCVPINIYGCNCNPCYPDHSCCKSINNDCHRLKRRKSKSKNKSNNFDYHLFTKKTTNDIIMYNILDLTH